MWIVFDVFVVSFVANVDWASWKYIETHWQFSFLKKEEESSTTSQQDAWRWCLKNVVTRSGNFDRLDKEELAQNLMLLSCLLLLGAAASLFDSAIHCYSWHFQSCQQWRSPANLNEQLRLVGSKIAMFVHLCPTVYDSGFPQFYQRCAVRIMMESPRTGLGKLHGRCPQMLLPRSKGVLPLAAQECFQQAEAESW